MIAVAEGYLITDVQNKESKKQLLLIIYIPSTASADGRMECQCQ